MSGIFGSSGGNGLPVFDFSALSGYYAAKTQLRIAQSSASSAQSHQTSTNTASATEAKVAPWAQAKQSDSARLTQAMQTTNFVDVQNSSINQAGVARDSKKLFALYTGLLSLRALAQKSSEEATQAGERAGLDHRFQTGLDQIKSFITEDGFDDLTLLFGKRDKSVNGDLSIARNPIVYAGKAIVQGSSANAIAGLSGTEVFTVSAAKAGGTVNVTIDLSQIGSTPSVDNIIAYMNQQMQTAGLITRFARVVYNGRTDTSPKSYGIQVQNVATEKISFNAAATSPAIYVAGASGTGTTQSGQLVKLTDQGTSVATNFSAQIAPSTGTGDARGTATDAQGNTYVVGTVSGDLGDGIVQGAQDVYLRKYDSGGQLVWSHMLGSSTTADAFGVAVDGSGNVAIAGRVSSDRLSSLATGGRSDSFVAKYDSLGNEVFVRQIDPVLDDQANTLTFGADGSIYVAGQTKGTIGSGQTSAGGTDAYLQKLTAKGSLVYTRQLGTSGEDRANAVSVDSDGNIVLATVEDGGAIVRKFADDDSSAAIWEKNLGDLGSGTIGGIALDNGAIYVSGTTTNADLTASGEATVAQAAGGGADGFVLRLDDGGTSATANFVSYIGTSGSDSAGNVVVSNGQIYVAGATNGALGGGTAPTSSNAYVAKFDGTGAQVWVHQYAGSAGAGAARAIAIDAQGGSVLDVLGLPRTITQDPSRNVTAQSTVRAGDFFYLSINGLSPHKITVQSGDTMRSLAARITGYLGLKGNAKVTYGSDGDKLTLMANEGSIIELKRGDGSFDALAGLGIAPGKLYNTKTPPATSSDKDKNVYAMGLSKTMSLAKQSSARLVVTNLNQALDAVRNAYAALTMPASTGTAGASGGSVVVQRQIASYQTALAALTGSGG